MATKKLAKGKASNTLKKNGYAIIWDKWISGSDEEFAEKVYSFINSKDVQHFKDSRYWDIIQDSYLEHLDFVIEDFLERKKLKKVSKKDMDYLKSGALFNLLIDFDNAKKDGAEFEGINHIKESYFNNDDTEFALGIGFLVTRIETDFLLNRFVPKMDVEKAYDKMLKWYVKPEATDFQVPQLIKYKLAKVKQHIDIYMWEEFLKQEYYTAKLTGLEDEGIIDLFDRPEIITRFCNWCTGYAEGVNESEINLEK